MTQTSSTFFSKTFSKAASGRFRPRPRGLSLALLALAALIQSGCGWAAVGALVSGGGSSGGGGANGPGSPPQVLTLQASPIMGQSRPTDLSEIRLSFTLVDPDEEPTDITVEFTTDPQGPGRTFNPCLITQVFSNGALITSGTLTDLPTTAAGRSYEAIWSADQGNLNGLSTIALRITPRNDKGTGLSATIENILVGNDPPAVDQLDPLGNNPGGGSTAELTSYSGIIIVKYRLFDSSRDPTRVRFQYTLDNGATFFDIPAGDILAGQTNNLLPDGVGEPTPTAFDLVWDTTATLGPVDIVGVRVAMVPDDRLPAPETVGLGQRAMSRPFIIANNTPPEINILEPAFNPDVSGPITLRYVLLDDEGDNIDVIIQYARDEDPVNFPVLGPEFSDPATRSRILSDPDLRSRFQIVTPRLRTLLEGQITRAAAGSILGLVINGAFMPAGTVTATSTVAPALSTMDTATLSLNERDLTPQIFDRLRGASVEVLDDASTVVDTALITSTSYATRTLAFDRALNLTVGRRVRLKESLASVSLDRSSSTASGVLNSVVWDAPRDLAVSGSNRPYLIRVTTYSGPRIGQQVTSTFGKRVLTDRFLVGSVDLRMQTPDIAMLEQSLQSSPSRLASTDFDGDGDDDLLVVRRAPMGGDATELQLVQNQGSVLFAPAAVLARLPLATGEGMTPNDQDLALGDVNGDGFMDVAISDASGPVGLALLSPQASLVSIVEVDNTMGLLGTPRRVLLEDLDFDGNLDLIVAYSSPGLAGNTTIAIWLGDGVSSFDNAPPTSIFAFADPNIDETVNDMVVENIDRTAAGIGGAPGLFLATAEAGLRKVIWDGNQQTLTEDTLFDQNFNAPAMTREAVDAITAVTFADFDRDGFLDILFGEDTLGPTASVCLILNFGGGLFFEAQSISSVGLPEVLAGRDINGDGIPDLTVGDLRGGRLRFFVGGRPTEDDEYLRKPNQDQVPNLMGLKDFTFGDFDNSGVMDLMTLRAPTVSAAPAPPPTLNLVLGLRGTIFGDSRGDPAILDSVTNRLKLADVDGDGLTDVLVTSEDETLTAFLNSGDGEFFEVNAPPFSFVGTTPFGFDLADFNRDGVLDAVVAYENDGTATLDFINNFIGDASGAIAGLLRVSIAIEQSQKAVPEFVFTADVNNDNLVDVVFLTPAIDQLGVLLNTTGGFSGPPTLFTLPRGSGVSTARLLDTDGDGFLDLLLSGIDANGEGLSGQLIILRNNGDGSFNTTSPVIRAVPSGLEITDMALADINRDGLTDYLIVSESQNTFEVLLDSPGGLVSGFSISNLLAPNEIAVGDLDGDGFLDVAIGQQGNGAAGSASAGNAILLLRGLAGGSFIPGAPVAISPANAYELTITDMDGDGLLDIVWIDAETDQVIQRLNAGREPESALASGRPRPATPAAISGGGLEDIVLFDRGTPWVINTTTGTIDGLPVARFQAGRLVVNSFDLQTNAVAIVEGEEPLQILAAGDVFLDGELWLRGGDGADGGPGFRGGAGGLPGPGAGAGGFGGVNRIARGGGEPGVGPGGGAGGLDGTKSPTGIPDAGGPGQGGGHAAFDPQSFPIPPGNPYGSPTIQRLRGGSGGGGGGLGADAQAPEPFAGGGGGGGGGALRVFAANVSVDGIVSASGGFGGGSFSDRGGRGGGGAGGAILLQAIGQISLGANAILEATGGFGGFGGTAAAGGQGAPGRIRLEDSDGTVNLPSEGIDPIPSTGTLTIGGTGQ